MNAIDRAGRQQAGFSLVELAIVLAIVALLLGGILAGRSLVRASQLNSIVTDYQRYSAAMQTFHEKYQAIAGDMKNATQYWGFAGTSVAPGCVTNSGAATAAAPLGTCDGDGNGTITYNGADGKTSEAFQAWRQLALAGLIEGNYSGVAGPVGGSGADYVIGTNSPRTKITGVTWMLSYIDDRPNPNPYSNHMFDLNYLNWMGIGSQIYSTGTGAGSWADDAFLKNSEAWSIDTKLDDGMPATGSVHAMGLDAISGCTNTTDNTNLTATYNLTSTKPNACALLFQYR